MIFSSIRQSWYSRLISLCLMVAFGVTMVVTPRAQASVMGLPQPGTMVDLSPAYVPLMITGLTVHPDNPLLMDFIISTGNSGLDADQVKKQSDRLIKYFLACLTIPENNQWVNLSPYEKQRIIPEDLGQTVLGQDMLAQDYILKQLTASLIYPEKNLGKNFWDKVYAQASQKFGTTQIPVNTFNKVWILPQYAKVYEHKDTVFVVKSHLKVMLDEDYLALTRHSNGVQSTTEESKGINNLGSQIIRQIILPAIEQEVNTGKNFAQLRQIYNSMILAVWFKKNLKQALLNQVYTDKSKVNGVNVDDPAIKQKIYQQYLQAYKKGVFNYIKEDINQANQEIIPRKYFSGGIKAPTADRILKESSAQLAADLPQIIEGKMYRETVLNSGIPTPGVHHPVPFNIGNDLSIDDLRSALIHQAAVRPELEIRAFYRSKPLELHNLYDRNRQIEEIIAALDVNGRFNYEVYHNPENENISILISDAVTATPEDVNGIEDDDGPDHVLNFAMTAADLLKKYPNLGLKIASDADGIRNWVSPHGVSLVNILNNIIKEYDIRGYDGGDDQKFPTQIDDEQWKWLGRVLGSIPFISERHQRTVGLEEGDFFLVAGDNGPSTGGLGEVHDKSGKKLPNVLDELSNGLMDSGVNIINLNVVGAGALYSTIDDLMDELKKDPEQFRRTLQEAGVIISDEEFDNLKRVKGGLYVTRSHVEIGTNGVKPNIDGITLYGDMLQAMKPFIINGIYREVSPEKRGKMFKNAWMREAALDIYERSIKEQFSGLKASLEKVAAIARASGKPAPKVIANFSGGALAATKRANGEKYYLKLLQDVLGDNLKDVLRSDGDTWNENGGLADPTRLDAVALGNPKADIVKASQDNPNDIIINFDLDADRISILQNGRLFLGDEMFYPVIEYQLTLDPYAEIHRTQVPIYFDSRMKSEFAAQVRRYGGIAKIHPKGHSKVKATIDVEFRKLVDAWAAAQPGREATKEAYLKAHPGFKIVQAEYSTHMFMTDTRGNAFDDAVRFGLFWLQAFAEVQIAKQKSMTMAEYIQAEKDDPVNPLPDSKQLKEQRTSVSSIGPDEKIVPVSDDQKKALIHDMTGRVRSFFADRPDEFEFIPDWKQYEGNNKPFVLVDVEGVYHLFINKPGLEGEIFWGWSNTSNKVAFGTQSPDANVNKQLAEIAVALLVESRNKMAAETGLNWIPIEDLETKALSDLFGGLKAAAVEAEATGQYPNAAAALETINAAMMVASAVVPAQIPERKARTSFTHTLEAGAPSPALKSLNPQRKLELRQDPGQHYTIEADPNDADALIVNGESMEFSSDAISIPLNKGTIYILRDTEKDTITVTNRSKIRLFVTVTVDHAALSKGPNDGGIDLNSRTLNLESSGQKVNITFNAAMIAQFRRGDFSGVRIQILDIVPVNLMPLLGLKEDEGSGLLAKA